MEREWIDLSAWWPQIEAIALARKTAMQGKSTGRHWIENTDMAGCAGEVVFAVTTGRKVSTVIRSGPGDCWDGGVDFHDADGLTIDVKASIRCDVPVSLCMEEHPRHLADLYVLTVVDLKAKRGAYVGWTTGQRLMRAEVRALSPDVEVKRHALPERLLKSCLI